MEDLFSRATVEPIPIRRRTHPHVGDDRRPSTANPAGNGLLNSNTPDLSSSRQFVSSQGQRPAPNNTSLSPDRITSGSVDPVVKRKTSPIPSYDFTSHNSALSFVRSSVSQTEELSNTHHPRRRKSFAVERLSSSKGIQVNSPGSNSPTSPWSTMSASPLGSTSPASLTSSPLSQSNSPKHTCSSINPSLPGTSPPSGQSNLGFSSPIQDVHESNFHGALALRTFQGNLLDPKVVNKRLLQSVQRHHRGNPDCQGPFIWKRNGRRHHAYPPEVVPYPLAIDREALDLDIVDDIFLFGDSGKTASGSRYWMRRWFVSTSAWIMAIAPEWPECHFVGFDCLPLQTNLSATEPGLAERVEWINGSFLELPLPFDNEYFDYVHVKQIGKAVPEDKWDLILEDIARILIPGGVVEVVEEDILFPRVNLPSPRKTKRFQGKNESLSPPPPMPLPLSPDAHYQTTNDQSIAKSIRNYTPEVPSTGVVTLSSSSPLFSYGPRDKDSKGSSADELTGADNFSSQSNNPNAIPSSSFGPGQSMFEPRGRKDSALSMISTISTSTIGRHLRSRSPPSPVPPVPSLPTLYRQASQRFPDPVTKSIPENQLLERLYFTVYEKRFINLQPTSLLSNLLDIHFKKVSASPPICRYIPTRKPRRRRRNYVADRFERDLKEGIQIQPQDTKPPTRPHMLNPEIVVKQDTSLCMPDDTVARFKLIWGHEETAPIHLYRVLSAIMACKEAMWDEFMFMNGWTEADFEIPERAKFIRQERTEFDNLLEKYRRIVQSYFPFRDVVESKLRWKAPKKELKSTKALGEDDEMKEVSEVSEDEVPEESSGLGDNEDDENHGRMYRRIRLFYAFKAESTES